MKIKKPRPVGRPRLGKTTGRVELKLADADRKRWIAAAARRDMTLSEWLRWLADRELSL
jgi:hypothetical protein